VLNFLLAGVLFTVLGTDAGLAENAHAAIDAMTSDIRFLIVSVSFLAGLLTLLAVSGCANRRSGRGVWVLACMSLLSFPIGMALGAYALWVLTRPEVRPCVAVEAS
jgi:lysylphosphatidylglycerol synthetase-like protein (DUF2156 family)